MRAPRSRLSSLGAAMLLGGCASDAVELPEATVTTPGAFVAVDESPDHLTLLRVLDIYDPGGGLILFVTVYDVTPATFPEAADLAREPDLPVGLEVRFEDLAGLRARTHDVVWFRTLTPEELARVP